MTTTRAVWIFILVLTAIRLALLGATQLSPDEAYYWMWSQRPAFSYFSKGPGVAFAIRASTTIFGDNEFGVRFWSPLLAAGTSLLIFYFAQRLFSPLAGLLDGGGPERHAHLQSRQPRFHDRSALALLLGGGALHFLACDRALAALLLVVAADRAARRGRVFSANTPTRLSLSRSFSSSSSPGGCGANFSGRIFISSSSPSPFAPFRRFSGIRSTPGSRSRISNPAAVSTRRPAFIRSSC